MKKNILFIFFVFSKIALSCECPSIKPISKETCQNYDIIFEGKLDSVSNCLADGTSTAYFFINELYKGSVQQHVEVGFDCSSACMMSFSKGEQWLIYSNFKRFDKMAVNLCGHSRRFFDDPSQDYYQLNAERTFEDEKQFLKTTFGIQSFKKNDELYQEGNELRNTQPSGTNKLWLLIISSAVMAIVYLVSKIKKQK